MAKITIQNEEGQYLNRYKMTPVDDQPNTYDLERAADITKQGTPFGPDTMEHYVQTEDLEAHTTNTIVHITDTEHEALNAAVQSATIGGSAVTKSGTTLQLPAYPTTLPANGGTASNTTSVSGALTVSTAAPSSTLAAGKLWGVY